MASATGSAPMRATRPAPKCAARTGAARTGAARTAPSRSLLFFSETERFAQAQIQGKSPRTGQRIDQHDGFTRWGNQVKRTVLGDHDVLRIRIASRERGPIVEDRVAIEVLPSRNVEWNSRTCNEK